MIGLTSGELWLVKFGLWILTSTFKVLVLTFVLYIISWYVLRSPKIVNSKAFQKTKDWFLVTFDVNNTINMIKEKTESKLKKIQSDGEFVEKTSKAKTVKLVDLFSVLKKEKEKKIDL
ncbi:hypothetical protein [Campylobacter canis]|uniref:hypothetical protein n=1 Tax=Campylobacter canis TaxID=3378588 RepID=UPI003C6FF175